MVVHEYAACEECGTVHTLRIGMGAEPVQKHHFACTHCGLEMGLAMTMGRGLEFGPNAVRTEPKDGTPIVNLHPDFVFDRAEIGSEKAFPSLEQGARMIMAAMAARRRAGLPQDFDPHPMPHLTEEWDALRAAWSLTRNGKLALAERRLEKFLETEPYPEPPATLADWLFQYAARLVQPAFEPHFEALFGELQKAVENDDFERFTCYYGDNLSVEHGRRYLELMRAYLGAFSELSQVHRAVSYGIEITDEHVVASNDFDKTRMLYGDVFEAFSSNVEVLAMLNNLISGRRFDEFEKLTLGAYSKLDKASRFGPFARNAAFAAICEEADNQLRNASHHDGMTFDRASGEIAYRTCKGGQGEERSIGYARYLAKCAALFVQAMLLFRLEILIADKFKVRWPF